MFNKVQQVGLYEQMIRCMPYRVDEVMGKDYEGG